MRPDGWPVGVNTELIGREDPATTNRSPYAIVLTKERDMNKDGVADRNSTVTQTCNPRVLNDCYLTGKRHVIFENRDATTSAVTIHAWADNNEDGKQPTDATAWGETATLAASCTYAPAFEQAYKEVTCVTTQQAQSLLKKFNARQVYSFEDGGRLCASC